MKNIPNYIFGKQLFTEIYETKFGICDHLNTINPLASVQFNDSENYLKDGLYENYLATFMYRELGSKLNISFDEFLDQPKYKIESMLKVASEVDRKKNQVTNNVLENINNNKDVKLD